MPAGTSEDFAQPATLESTRFSTAGASPSYLFCIIVHATMKRTRRQELRWTRAENAICRERPRRGRRRKRVYEWWSAPSSKKFLMSPAGNVRRKRLPALADRHKPD